MFFSHRIIIDNLNEADFSKNTAVRSAYILDARADLHTEFLVQPFKNQLRIQRLGLNFYWMIVIVYSIFVMIVDTAVLLDAVRHKNLQLFVLASVFFIGGGVFAIALYLYERKKIKSLLKLSKM